MMALLLGLSAVPPEQIALIYQSSRPFPLPPCERCVLIDLDGPQSPETGPIRGVVLAGHSTWGVLLGRQPEDVAAILGRLAPDGLDWLVLDTCLGLQAPFLHALAIPVGHIVGSTETLPPAGFDYGDVFKAVVSAADLRGKLTGRGRAVIWLRGDSLAALHADLHTTEAWALAEVKRCHLPGGWVLRAPFVLAASPRGPTLEGPVLVGAPAGLIPPRCRGTRPRPQ